jgi:hypothetical protein
MRKLRKPASEGLAGLVLFILVAWVGLVACGGGNANQPSAAASPACINAAAAHHVHVVVAHAAGATLDRCVGFATDKVAAADLMAASGISFKTQHFSFGDAACAIDGEPQSFDTCLPQGAPYWALWTATAGGVWQMAQTGFTDVKLGDGDALGWRYTPASEASPSPPPAAKK